MISKTLGHCRLVMAIILTIVGMYFTVGAQAGGSTIIYIGARNCGACHYYEGTLEDGVRLNLKSNGIKYRRVVVNSFRNINNVREYPKDLKWIPTRNRLQNGTPTFVLVRGGRVLNYVLGYNELVEELLPQMGMTFYHD